MSFLAHANRKVVNTDLHDALVRGRRLLRRALVTLAVIGCAWVVIESAQALSVF